MKYIVLTLLAAQMAAPRTFAAGSKKTSQAIKKPEASVAVSTTATNLPQFSPSTSPITVPFAIEQFERFDREMATLTATFRQTVRSDDTGQTQAVEGRFAYRKKDLMRIEHRAPERQTLVCDGQRVWVWRPSNNQVIRSRLEDWKRSQPLAQGILDFGNYAQLLRRYDVSVGTVSSPGSDGHRNFSLVLTPRPEAGAAKQEPFTLTLRLSTRDFFPYDSELRVGSVTASTLFHAVRYNPELPENLFQFSPPAGADVLEFPAAPAPGTRQP
ncbi:MAG TPA: hypothetical protein DEB40_04155 [Elusimicrobia bacterium]|nr:hypothetical protein [Elusimicrobiota bacterium]HBT60918.1 hypothetical protein [Elusimicrobiota bacterium]